MLRRPPKSTPFPYTPLFRSSFPPARPGPALPHREHPLRRGARGGGDRKSTRLNSSHTQISYSRLFLFFKCCGAPRNLLPSPTRPSSDLPSPPPDRARRYLTESIRYDVGPEEE